MALSLTWNNSQPVHLHADRDAHIQQTLLTSLTLQDSKRKAPLERAGLDGEGGAAHAHQCVGDGDDGDKMLRRQRRRDAPVHLRQPLRHVAGHARLQTEQVSALTSKENSFGTAYADYDIEITI